MIDLQHLPADSGIYCIQNTIDGKCYIGKSVNIRKRVSRHKGELTHGKHHNQHLQCAWNLYGGESFIALVVELCSKTELADKEIYHIGQFGTTNNGYNLTDGGEGALGRIVSEETREKIRSKQPNFHGGFSPKAHKIVLLNTSEVFQCVGDASIAYSTASSAISNCCRGVTKSAGKHMGERLVWAYLEDYQTMTKADIDNAIYAGQMSKARANNGRARAVVLSNTGEIFMCASDASEKYSVGLSSILACCKHKSKYAGKHLGEKLVWEFYVKEVVA